VAAREAIGHPPHPSTHFDEFFKLFPSRPRNPLKTNGTAVWSRAIAGAPRQGIADREGRVGGFFGLGKSGGKMDDA